MCLCRFAAERDDDLAMESSFAQQQFEEQRRFVQGMHLRPQFLVKYSLLMSEVSTAQLWE